MLERKKKSSPDYSRLAQKITEASEDEAVSKPSAGLYLVATPIGHLGDISLRALMTLAQADCILCEDTRNSGALLSKYGIKKTLISCHDHNEKDRLPEILQRLAAGEVIALISDAGLPLIADPGYKLARECSAAGYDLVVIPGANAALTALAGSGLPTDRFTFAGFLPSKSTARQKAIEELKAISSTLVLYEAPQRLADSLADLAKGLGDARPAAVARELTKLYEETRRGTLRELADFYAVNDVKGEIVILIAPPDESAPPSHDLEALLKQHLKNLSLRDAVAAVAALTGMKKSLVYAEALKCVEEK